MIFDIETDGLDLERISAVWCICCIDESTGEELRFGPREIPQGLETLASAERLVGHNISTYDLPVLRHLYGFTYAGPVADTLVLSRMLVNGLCAEADEHGRHSLSAWGTRLGLEKGGHTDFSKFSGAMLKYCAQDCRVTQRLLKYLRTLGPRPEAVRLELDYDAFLRRIERHGFTLDIEGTERLRAKLERRLDRLQDLLDGHFPPKQIPTNRREYYTYASANGRLFEDEFPKCRTKTELEAWRREHKIRPREVQLVEGPPVVKTVRFNATSPAQVIPAMRSLGWDPPKENKSGSIHTGEVVLYQSGLPAGRLIAAYRGFRKLHSFTTQWLKHARGGKLYPNFIGNQAATGRSSCRAPNIQQIPSTKRRKSGMRVLRPYGRRCRALFRPQSGYVLTGADLKGIEVRLLAHRLSQYDGGDFADRLLVTDDIHQENADQIGIPRDTAKTVLYGSMYGQGARSLAAELEVSQNEAQDILDGFTSGISGFEAMRSHLITEYRRDKRIELIDGRKIQVGSEHRVLNYAIQGDAAILMKHWALSAEDVLGETSLRILAVVHHEIQAECLPDEVQHIKRTLENLATVIGERLGFRIRIDADAKDGPSWAETH